MAVFRDKKNGSWYVQFRFTDWKGQRQQKLKRGFSTKKEAQNWEREFLMKKQADVDMTFESFVELYEKNMKPKLKLNTWLSKEHIIRTKILPYFKKRKLAEITARDVIDWQNEIRELKNPMVSRIQRIIWKIFTPNSAACSTMQSNTTAFKSTQQPRQETWEMKIQKKCFSGRRMSI